MKCLGHENETKAYIETLDDLDYGCRCIASILNKEGKGELYIGVNRLGNIIGVNSFTHSVAQTIFERIQKTISPIIYPSISYISKLNIIKISFEGEQQPYICKKNYLIRYYDENREMDYTSLMNEIRFNNQNRFYEDSKTSEYIKDVNENIIKDIYARNKKKAKYSSIRDSLKKLGLINDGNLNRAGRALFSKKSPIDIQINLYADEQKKIVKKTQLIKGNIFELLDKTVNIIDEEQLEDKSSKRINKDLLYETMTFIFLNSSFNQKEPFIIHVSPYEITFKFPGTLFFLNTLEEFYEGEYIIQNRNKLIGRVFTLANITGSTEKCLRKIEKICKENNIVFSSTSTDTSLSISYYRYSQKKKGVTLEQAILSILNTRPMIKADLLAKKLNRTRRTIQTAIKKLKESNLITRKGSNKNGYWIVNK
jgi:ATP-dependent DNA helicase RecG